MSRKTKRVISMSITMVLVAALAGLYFWQVNREAPAADLPDTPAASTVNHLVRRAENEVTRVSFTANGQSYAMIPSTDAQGQITWLREGSEEYVLNHWLARDKAQAAWVLFSQSEIHEDATGLNLADFGLNPPLLTMSAYYDDGTTHSVTLGGQTADMRYHFLMMDGDPAIHLVSAAAARRMLSNLEDMLDRTLPEFDIQMAMYIKISQRDHPVFELALRDLEELIALADSQMAGMPSAGQLVMHQPLAGRNPNHYVINTRLLEPFGELVIGDVVSLNPASLEPFGLHEPELEFIYHSMEGHFIHLLFGNGRYVKFADRPHVFEADFAPVNVLLDINPLHYIERFIALEDIRFVERITISSPDTYRNFDLVLNHEADDVHTIHPTINNHPVEEDSFRVVYRLLIGLTLDAMIEPAPPQTAPEIIITYHRKNAPNLELSFFPYNDLFFAVSENGEYPWYITNRMEVDTFFQFLMSLYTTP